MNLVHLVNPKIIIRLILIKINPKSSSDSAGTDQNESESSSDSDSNDNHPGNGQVSNPSNNKSDGDNQSRDSQGSDQCNNDPVSNIDVNKSADQKESESSSDKKFITDGVPDWSDSFSRLFSDPPIKGEKSTVDFVVQKQQEEMPDIMDSDGGD